MSAVEEQTEQRDGPQRERLFRAFPAELSAGDGRTLDVRIVPYNESVEVGDPPWAPKSVYREAFLPGAFDRQLRAADKVVMDVEHEDYKRGGGFMSWIGRATMLRSAPDGLYGTFRIFEGEMGDKALALVREGVLGAVSMEFEALKSIRRSDGLVQRARAHLDKVALLRQGAYEGSKVLAVRQAPIVLSGDDLAQPLANDTILKLRAAGLTVPDELLRSEDRVLRAAPTFVEAPWDGSESRWPDAASYCSACVIDKNPAGNTKQKLLCHLPVKEPDSGDVNVNAVRAALARLDQVVGVSAADKASAKTKLESLLASYNNAEKSESTPDAENSSDQD